MLNNWAYNIDLMGSLREPILPRGVAKAWRIQLKSVQVGQLKQNNVEAMVVDGTHPIHVLLGMSFLERLKVEKEGIKMVLQQKK